MKQLIAKTKMNLVKYSPEILIVSGVFGIVTSAVMACKATTKIDDILSDTKQSLDNIKMVSADKEYEKKYNKEDANKDLTIVYIQTGIKLAKLYAPSVILGTLSIGGILMSNNILQKRNVALAAAYASLDTGFKNYRQRVIKKVGEEVEKEIFYNVEKNKVEVVEEDENGKKTKYKKDILVIDDSIKDPFTFFFDSGNPYWENDGNYNRLFLSAQQQIANDKLRANGFVFLNDVLHELGIERTREGQILGWTYDPDNKDIDNFIDFGIVEAYRKDEVDYNKVVSTEKYNNIDKYRETVLLNFNVDGNVLDVLPTRTRKKEK